MGAPVFENYDDANGREALLGDFMICVSPIVGVQYDAASHFRLIGCTVVCGGYPGSRDGIINRVYQVVSL